MAKINDTTTYPSTTPATGDRLIGTDVSNTTNDPNGETVSFTVGSLASLYAGTSLQAFSAALNSIAGLTTTSNRMIYTTASNTYAVTPLTSFARTLLDDSSASTARSTLGLGTIATLAAPSGSVVGTTDTQTLTNKTLTDPTINGGTASLSSLTAPTIIGNSFRSAGVAGILTRGPNNEVILESRTVGSSAVDYLRLTNSTGAGDPTISAQGTSTDIDISLAPKGAGVVKISAPVTGDQRFVGHTNLMKTQNQTISGGSITIGFEELVIVDTEGGASSDDLSTIVQPSIPADYAMRIVVKCANSGRDVNVVSGGNIDLVGGVTCVLGDSRDTLVLYAFAGGGNWRELSRATF